MKKSLIALAVLGTAGLGFSSAAVAQSSVTMYGVADAGLSRVEGPKDPVTGKRDRVSGMSSAGLMNNGDSRLGVRGVEDLGGGLKAGFNFETGLDLNDGGSTGSAFWQRNANVWIGGNWGTFQMGRALTPSFFGVTAWELTGAANYTVVGNTYGWAGAGSRNNSMFVYKTPSFSGFGAQLGYIAKDNNSGQDKWDANITYANGPIGVGLSANKVKNGKTNYAVGGKYNFGQFAVAASYNGQNVTSNTHRRGASLGGSFNTGPFTATLDVTRDTSHKVAGVDVKKYTNGLLEGKYALSKRTFVYAAYLRLDDTNNYGIGLRHNF